MMGDEVDEDSDEGPSDLPGIGGQLVEKIIRTLWASASWKDTAVFITYDENGGIADHVPPAPACSRTATRRTTVQATRSRALQQDGLPRAVHRRLALREGALRVAHGPRSHVDPPRSSRRASVCRR